MFRETVICIIIIIVIFSLDVFTQNYTEKSIGKMAEMLENLRTEILNNNTEKVKSDLSNIDESWQAMHDKLAYYIEHDELEKVDTAIVNMRSYIETEDISSAVAELEEGKFVLEHIGQKNEFNLQNIF